MGKGSIIRTSEEEAFFDQNFQYGDDPETVEENMEKALTLFESSYSEVTAIAEMVEDGECYDTAATELAFKRLRLSYLFLQQFYEGRVEELYSKLSQYM